MKPPISGLHHITAIARDPQANVDFYAGLLGLRLVKKTVNFDDPSAYHLYYGDAAGTPGSALTFFYWPGNDSPGTIGPGQASAFSFSTAPAGLGYWQERLSRNGVKSTPVVRFGENGLRFADPDGIQVEIVGVADDGRAGWTGAGISPGFELRGFHSVELAVQSPAGTENLLTQLMGFEQRAKEGNRTRFGIQGSGTYADVLHLPDARHGLMGTGTVHHVAWRVPNDDAEATMRTTLMRHGYHVSPVMDRTYFHSIYYREKADILFEIATDQPGFAVDEAPAALGEALKLPSRFEHARKEIEKHLPPLRPAKRYE